MTRMPSRIASALVVLSVAVVAAQSTGVHPISGRRYAGVMGFQGADWLFSKLAAL